MNKNIQNSYLNRFNMPINPGKSGMFSQTGNNGLLEYTNSSNDTFVKQDSVQNNINAGQIAAPGDSYTKKRPEISNNFLIFTNKTNPPLERRIQNIPVNVENRSGHDRRQSERVSKVNSDIHKIQTIYKDFIQNTDQVKVEVNKFDETIHNKDSLQKTLSALGFIVPFRRMTSVPDKLDNKDYFGLVGSLAVAGILLPEDLRDTGDGLRQILHKILPESVKGKIRERYPKFFKKFVNFAPKYNYKEYQTPFSFIRGSFLEKLVNKYLCNKFGYNLYKWDKPLLETKFGQKIMVLLKVEKDGWIDTGRIVQRVMKDEEGKYIIGEIEVVAKKLKGSKIGKLICRALNRTTVYGTISLSVLCLPSIIKAFTKPEKAQDKLVNGSKQTLKSAVGVSSTLSRIGLIGALCAPLDPAGSLAGMAIGSTFGTCISNNINKNIKTKN